MSFLPQPVPFQVTSGELSTAREDSEPRAPNFLRYLNECAPPKSTSEQAPAGEQELRTFVEQHVLPRIWEQLSGPLDYIWDYGDAKYGHHVYWNPTNLEEQWARRCTEQMAVTAYSGPPAYGSPCGTEKYFYRSFFSDNPVMPIGLACQHLCTYALFFRGYTYEMLVVGGLVGVAANQNSHLNAIFDGGWDFEASYAKFLAAYDRKAPLGPGTLFGYNPHDQNSGITRQDNGSHVVFLLRELRGLDKGQFLDTGALNNRPDSLRPYAIKQSTGNYDGELFDNADGDGRDRLYCGMGVLKPNFASERLFEGLQTARRQRPLGVARLALFRRPPGENNVAKDDILYISPWLQMHHPSSQENFYATRFLWSLRAMPGYQNLQAVWQLAFVAHDLAKTLADAPRSESLGDIATRVSITFAHKVADALWLTVDADGRARCLKRAKTKSVKKVDDNGNHIFINGVPQYEQDDDSTPKAALTHLAVVQQQMTLLPIGQHYLHASWQTFGPPEFFRPWS